MTYERELPTDAAHALTHNQEVWSDHGWAVVTAGGLTSGSNALQLDVGEYDVLTGGTSSTTVGPATIDAQLPTEEPYWLVVYVDGNGDLQTATGPEGTVAPGLGVDVREISSPPPPTLASEGPVAVLGRALVTSDGIADSRIDDRVFSSERVFDTIAARSAEVDEASVGGTEFYAWLNNQQSVSSGTIETIQFDNVEDDTENEWDGANYRFIPTETGDYWVSFSVESRDSNPGDSLLARFRDVDGSKTLLRARSTAGGGSFETNQNTHRTELIAGNEHELQFRNNNSDDTIEVGDGSTFLVVRRAV